MWWATEGRWWWSFLKSFNCQWIWFRKLVCGVFASLSVLHFPVAQTCSKGLPRSRKLMKKICDSEHFLRDSIQNRRKFNKFWTQLYQLIMIRRWGGQDGRTGPSIPFSMMAIHHVPLGQLVMTFWNSLGLPRRKQVEQRKRLTKSQILGLRSKKQLRTNRKSCQCELRKRRKSRDRNPRRKNKSRKAENKFEL